MEIAVEVKRLIANQKQSTDLTQYINRIARENLRPGLWEDVDYIQQQVEGDDEEVIVSNPTRDEILSAKKLLYRGMRLIDDEIYSIHKKEHLSSPPFDFWRSYHDFDRRNNDFYDQNIFREELSALRSIVIFPNCFYFPPPTVQQGDNFYVERSEKHLYMHQKSILLSWYWVTRLQWLRTRTMLFHLTTMVGLLHAVLLIASLSMRSELLQGSLNGQWKMKIS